MKIVKGDRVTDGYGLTVLLFGNQSLKILTNLCENYVIGEGMK